MTYVRYLEELPAADTRRQRDVHVPKARRYELGRKKIAASMPGRKWASTRSTDWSFCFSTESRTGLKYSSSTKTAVSSSQNFCQTAGFCCRLRRNEKKLFARIEKRSTVCSDNSSKACKVMTYGCSNKTFLDVQTTSQAKHFQLEIVCSCFKTYEGSAFGT